VKNEQVKHANLLKRQTLLFHFFRILLSKFI